MTEEVNVTNLAPRNVKNEYISVYVCKGGGGEDEIDLTNLSPRYTILFFNIILLNNI